MTTPIPAKGMGRKPASIGQYGTQDAIWQAVRETVTFSPADLICHINKTKQVNDYTVKSYLSRLFKGGYLEKTATGEYKGACKTIVYTLVKNTGIETPRLTKSGQPSTQGKGREQLWRTIKILKEFDWFDLQVAASTESHPIKTATVRDYCEILAKAGYLTVTRKGRGTIRARYRLVSSRNTGPRPPQIQRLKQLFDPNLNAVVYVETGGQHDN
jgi:hypothetical protein